MVGQIPTWWGWSNDIAVQWHGGLFLALEWVLVPSRLQQMFSNSWIKTS